MVYEKVLCTFRPLSKEINVLRALMIPIAISTAHASFADNMRACTEGDLDTTIAGCSKVIAANSVKPYLVVALANRAIAYQRKGQAEKAKSDVDAAIGLDSQWGYLYRIRGGLYARQGAIDKAREDIDKSLIIDPTDAATFYLSCQLWFQMANYGKAASDCSSTIELDPHVAKGYLFRGQSYWFEGKYRRAVDDLFKAVLLDQSSAQTYALLGDSYLQIGDQDRALEALENAIKLEPKILIARFERGKIYQAKGDKAKAASDYRAALAFPANDDYSRKLQSEALESLTAMQEPASPPPAAPRTGAGTPPDDPSQSKKSMCKFADVVLRKKLGCNEP